MGNDVIDRMRVEEALREAKQAAQDSQDQYEQVVSMISDIVWRYDVNARGEPVGSYISPVADRMLGLPDGTIGNSFDRYFSYVHPDDLPDVQKIIFEGLRTLEKDKSAEYRLRKADGTMLWVRSKGSAYSQPDGQVNIFGTTSDITEHKRTEEALRENEERFRTLFESSQDALMILAPPSWKFSSGNKAAVELFRAKDMAEFTSLGPWDVSPQRQLDGRLSADKSREMIETAIREGSHFFEWTHKQLRGEAFPCTVLLTRMELLGETVIQATVRDISAQKKTEEKIASSEALLNATLDSIPDIIGIQNPDHTIIRYNRAGYEFLNLSREEVHGRRCYELIGQNIPCEECATEKALKTKRLEQTEKYLPEYGVYLNCRSNPVLNEEGEIEFIVEQLRDITERKQLDLSRARSLLRQERLNLLQQNLLGPGKLEQKLKNITDGVVDIFGADFCRIWITSPGDLCEAGCIHAAVTDEPHVCRYEDRCLRLLASSGRYTHTDGEVHRRVPFGCYKIGRIASEQEHRFLTNEVQNETWVYNHEWAKEIGLVSFAGYQLHPPGGDALGVLALFSKQPITGEEDAQLNILSNTITQVIQTARVDEELLETLTEATRLNKYLNEQTARANEMAASGREGQCCQKRIPGQHEPRDSHPLERRHRHDRIAAGYGFECRAA